MSGEESSFIDIFAAPGGFSFGFELAGFKSIAGIDWDKAGMKTYSHNLHHSQCEIVGDIRHLTSNELMTWIGVSAGEIDVIIGGPPCQGFSNIGRVKIASLVRSKNPGEQLPHPRFIDDPRNTLYKEFVRAVRDFKPKVFVMENVPGIMSYKNGDIANQIIEDFESIGYKTVPFLLDAVQFGVPQIRKRVFFIGTCLNIETIPSPKPTHMKNGYQATLESSDWGSPLTDAVTVWDAVGDLPTPYLGKGRVADFKLQYETPPFSEYQRWAREGAQHVHNHITRCYNERDVELFQAMKEGQWWRDLPQRIKDLYGYRDDIFQDKMKRLRRDLPSWTIVAHLYKDGYMYIHPTRPRTITVREAARLQGFPDRFRFHGFKTHQYKHVGNAVPPLLAKAVAKTVREILDSTL